jgi:Flp pilus assembly pilin Flp
MYRLIQLRTWFASVLPHRDDDRGASVVEYALLLALIATVTIVAVSLIGQPVSEGLDSGGDGFRTP